MSYEQIPDEIKRLKRWVCAWDGSKCPMRAFEKRAASSTDPATWSDFETAQASVEAGYYDHLGFVFANDGIVGIDIDKGFTDGKMTALCRDIMSACMSYTEVSRSGRGVHILVRGSLPFAGKNNQRGVEIYSSGRFFITTGNMVTFKNIIANQAGIDYVVGKYFAEEPVRTPDCKKGNRIYSPTWEKKDGAISLVPQYQEILEGGRNMSLLSIAGQLRSVGYGRKKIYEELLKVNEKACKPPLRVDEVQRVVESVMKYKR